jgi:hypothetical protein
LQELPYGKEERPGGFRLPFGSGTGDACDLFGLRPAYNSAFRATWRSSGFLPGLLPGAQGQRRRRRRRKLARTRSLLASSGPMLSSSFGPELSPVGNFKQDSKSEGRFGPIRQVSNLKAGVLSFSCHRARTAHPKLSLDCLRESASPMGRWVACRSGGRLYAVLGAIRATSASRCSDFVGRFLWSYSKDDLRRKIL